MTETPATGVLVDSSILLDLFTDDPTWAAWSEEHLADAFDAGQVVINPVVYAEVSIAFARSHPARTPRPRRPTLGSGVSGRQMLPRVSPPRRYQTLPAARPLHRRDAAVTGRALLTRDANRYRTLLPALPLISP